MALSEAFVKIHQTSADRRRAGGGEEAVMAPGGHVRRKRPDNAVTKQMLSWSPWGDRGRYIQDKHGKKGTVLNKIEQKTEKRLEM